MKTKWFMGKIAAAFAMVVLFTLTATAQDKVTEGAKKITDNMKEDLSLTADQYKKVYDINFEFLTKAKDEKNAVKATGAKLQKKDKVKELKVIGQDREAKLKAVLTEEQFKKFEATKKENKDKLKEYYKEKKSKQ
jgi:hypothetical protein